MIWGKGLLTGMGITWKHFWGKKETVQYPEEKLPMTERFRGGWLVLDAGKCISCKLCSMACPNQALSLNVSIDAQKKRHMEEYIYHSGRCLYCNLCLESCPVDALHWDKNVALAFYHRQEIDHDCMPKKREQEVNVDA